MMNFESLEQMRYENTQQVMEALTKIVCDDKTDIKDRLEAAKIVDAMSDSLIKAQLMSDVTNLQESTTKKMISKLDRLTEKDD